jgi:predicted dehydrogenase
MHVLIIGAGSIGERHLRNFLRVDGVFCSFAEPDAARREKISGLYDAQSAFENWEDADLADFDGVVICTPTDTHVPLISRLIESDIGVLSEKPIATHPEGVTDLMDKIREKSACVGVAFCMRHHAVFGEMRRRFMQGDLGGVRTAFSFDSQYWPGQRPFWPPKYAMSRETGGGAISDHMVHKVNLFEWFFGRVESVSAFQRHISLPDIPTEDLGTVTLRFKDGQVAVLSTCLFQRNLHSQVELVGEKATARQIHDSDRLQIYRPEKASWETGEARFDGRDEMFFRQAEHFIACLRGDAEPRCTVEEAARTLQVVLAAIRSSDGDSRFVMCG